jgi:hypothetical protein
MQTKAKIWCRPIDPLKKSCSTWFQSDKPVAECPNCKEEVDNANYDAWYNTALTDEQSKGVASCLIVKAPAYRHVNDFGEAFTKDEIKDMDKAETIRPRGMAELWKTDLNNELIDKYAPTSLNNDARKSWP